MGTLLQNGGASMLITDGTEKENKKHVSWQKNTDCFTYDYDSWVLYYYSTGF